VFALSGLGGENEVSGVKGGDGIKKFEKHCAKPTLPKNGPVVGNTCGLGNCTTVILGLITKERTRPFLYATCFKSFVCIWHKAGSPMQK